MQKVRFLGFKLLPGLFILLLVLTACGTINTTSTRTSGTTATALPTAIATARPIPSPTPTFTSTPTANHPTGYEDFSETNPPWGNAQNTPIERVKNPFGPGYALKVENAPLQAGVHPGSQTASAPFAYGGAPSGLKVEQSGIIDLTGYRLEMVVEFDPFQILSNTQPNWARPYVADINYANYQGETLALTSEAFGHPITLTANVGSCPDDGPDFMSRSSFDLGLYIFAGAGSTQEVDLTYYILSVRLVWTGTQTCDPNNP